jgi:hypothetical protein
MCTTRRLLLLAVTSHLYMKRIKQRAHSATSVKAKYAITMNDEQRWYVKSEVKLERGLLKIRRIQLGLAAASKSQPVPLAGSGHSLNEHCQAIA